MKALLTALGCGALFGAGLCVSGMTDPTNVTAFLDVGGKWSPNLAGVMLGAIAVHFAWLRWLARRDETKREAQATSGKRVDRALVSGALLFGIGWGVSGYCPGPAIVSLSSGALGPLVFVGAMAAGVVLNEGVQWTIKRFGKGSLAVR
ncbi:MAG TPA: DUF6691 family protein [Polyangiaceae bacterium]|nr:DUF6691 family protein [Polyangiaceae bacterium]